MAKKMQRYLAVIDPIRKRFGCNTREAGDRIGTLLGYEHKNHELAAQIATLKSEIVETKKILEEHQEATAGMKEGFSERLETVKKALPEILGTLAGAGSMCWDPTPTGVFNATRAKEQTDEAIAKINEIMA